MLGIEISPVVLAKVKTESTLAQSHDRLGHSGVELEVDVRVIGLRQAEMLIGPESRRENNCSNRDDHADDRGQDQSITAVELACYAADNACDGHLGPEGKISDAGGVADQGLPIQPTKHRRPIEAKRRVEGSERRIAEREALPERNRHIRDRGEQRPEQRDETEGVRDKSDARMEVGKGGERAERKGRSDKR